MLVQPKTLKRSCASAASPDPNRPLGDTLILAAMVIGTGALGAVILYAVTGWLWLVAHQGLQ
jgi:hypothetical protein